ncbi:MAG: anaerobic ribonucleoside-triphosphate reductase [Paraclostridium sp.]
MYVVKKDGTKQKFDFKKIENAIRTSAERLDVNLTKHEISEFKEVVDIALTGKTEIKVSRLHKIVERALDVVNKRVAKSYKDFRNYKVEYGQILMNDIEGQVRKTLEEVDRENSNSNTRYISTKRTEIAKTFSKELYQKMFLSKEILQAMRDGFTYTHDLTDLILPQYNCALVNVRNILSGGFELEGIRYTEPKDIKTAVGQVGDIIMIISAQHFGGLTAPQIDTVLAPYYKMTIRKYFNKNLKRGLDAIAARDFAEEDAYDDLKQSLQGLEIKLNTVVSARGSYPFTTFSFGDVSDDYEADVVKAILEVRKEGHGEVGKKKNLIFPKLVFLHNKEIHGKKGEYRNLFDRAISTSSVCMYPDYLGENHKREGKWVSPIKY